MHALVAAVLLRMSGLDALDTDSQAQPPDRELREAEERVRARKGHAVIGANRQGKPKVLENPLKHRKCVALLGCRQSITADQIAAHRVGDRERVTIALVGELEL